ncbi:MAG: hypothetical protein H9872_07570 [Candidatus Cellulosilyticum pullistercoris]|uniref:thymidine kinase n=1 Tax=Candidatus Cellulosilyticum pullistercoris TaxID=2838521 RepID=A0A9E2KD29_9FIRM|nr:hypothetical protein [Candidatus Cellulosilyticum pullistercoris]
MGFFKVTVGVMGSSKSARAIAEVQNLKIRNLKTLVLKPELDTRDGGYICSRLIKDKVKADLLIKPDESIDVQGIVANNYDYIVVDEFHMLNENQVKELYKISAISTTNISMYGLRMSWKGTPFASAALALGYADEIEMIKMVDKEQQPLSHHIKYTNGVPSPLNENSGMIAIGDLDKTSYTTVSKGDFYKIYEMLGQVEQ